MTQDDAKVSGQEKLGRSYMQAGLVVDPIHFLSKKNETKHRGVSNVKP